MPGTYKEDQDYKQANEAFETGRLSAALGLFEKLVERYPDELELKRSIGLCAFEYALQRLEVDKSSQEDWRKAIRHLEEFKGLSGENAKIDHSLAISHHNLGVCLNQLEEFAQAHEHLSRALELDPEMTDISVSLAINYADQGDMDKAEELLRKVVASSPDSSDARLNLGLILSSKGQEEEAVEQFKKAQSPERDIVGIHYSLGVSYLNQGKADLAESAFRQTLELNPEFVPAHYNLGLILREKGDFSAAERCFEEVTQLDPDSPAGHFCLASLYERRNPALAVPVWERYLELAAGRPSEAEMIVKVTRHLEALKKRLKGSEGD